MWEMDFGKPVGIGHYGGQQYRVTVIMNDKNQVHGYLSGPEVR